MTDLERVAQAASAVVRFLKSKQSPYEAPTELMLSWMTFANALHAEADKRVEYPIDDPNA